jgi:hypothetical protein
MHGRAVEFGYVADTNLPAALDHADHLGFVVVARAGDLLSAGALVYQYCADGDLVCDVTAKNLRITNAANEGRIHASYGFFGVGVDAATRADKP